MTQASAEKFANVLLTAAAATAAYYIVRTPRLRRLAWQFGVAALTGTIPAWVSQEIKAGWEASGQPAGAASMMPQSRAV